MKKALNNSTKMAAGFVGMALALSAASAQVGSAVGSEVTPLSTSGVSSRTISPQALRPSFSPADLNHDGYVDGIDTDLFWNAYESGDRLADLNRDRYVDGMDYDAFMMAVEAAHPEASLADLNLDGFVDGMDADLFWNAAAAGSLAADVNHDGYFDGIDIDLFLEALEM